MDLRKERTLKLLADAFQGLVREQGYSSITVSQLCDRAMIRRATFYRHFSSKEDYLAHFVRSQRALVHEHVLAECEADDCREYCRRMTDQLIDLAVENQALLMKLRADGASDSLFFAVSREIASELGDALLERGAYADVEPAEERRRRIVGPASFYAAGLFGVLDRAIGEGRPLGRESLAELFDAAIGCVDFPVPAPPDCGSGSDGHASEPCT